MWTYVYCRSGEDGIGALHVYVCMGEFGETLLTKTEDDLYFIETIETRDYIKSRLVLTVHRICKYHVAAKY